MSIVEGNEDEYGRKIFIDTDHKLLESIVKKSLLSAPKRLRECCCFYRNLT